MNLNNTDVISVSSCCDEFELNKKLNINAHRFYTHKITKTSEKKLLTGLLVVVDEHYITTTFSQTNQLKEELFLFDAGDEQNEYAKIVERTLNNKKVKSLAITVNETKTIYLSKAVAKSIATLLNTAVNGFLLTSLRTNDLRDEYNLNLKDMQEYPQE